MKLPKIENEWNIPNDYFKLHLKHNSEITGISLTIRTFNQTVYNYFCNCCGPVNLIDNNLEVKKKVLMSHKVDKIINNTKIKYISRLMRSKLRKEEEVDAFNHNNRIKENYWKYCKNHIETNKTVLPTFSGNDCWKHFMKTCHEPKLYKVFNIASWMKQLEKPIKDFNIKPPTYNEINKIIIKMKSSRSSCSIDEVSALMLKKCPILRTTVWEICCYCWDNNHFPVEWKNSTTILIHKNGNKDNPSNFRPITLEPILSKVMTSYIRNRIFTFLVKNNYVETNFRKEFCSNYRYNWTY